MLLVCFVKMRELGRNSKLIVGSVKASQAYRSRIHSGMSDSEALAIMDRDGRLFIVKMRERGRNSKLIVGNKKAPGAGGQFDSRRD